MSETKSALIIANCRYEDPELRQLVAPTQDAESLARVLADPAIGGFEVRTLINEPSHKVNLEIESFFDNRKRDDLLLMYFTGHGIKDADNELYFATVNTQLVQHNVRRSTAVSSRFVNEVMSRSRSRRQILLLDCCYSGAFKDSMLAKGDNRVGAGEQLGGQGRIVLTASDSRQYSFEEGEDKGGGVRSVFTGTLVQGLESGEADLDRDGLFSLDEVYEYVYDRVSDQQPEQKPTKLAYIEGRIFIGANPRPLAANLSPELLEALDSPLVLVRVGAVQQLAMLLGSSNKGMVLAAQAKLSAIASADDSQQVRRAAANFLASSALALISREETRPSAELKTAREERTPGREEQPQEDSRERGSLTETSAGVKARPVLGPVRPVPTPRLASCNELLTLRGHTDSVHTVAWSPDGKRLATGSEDGTAKVWAAESGKELFTLRGSNGSSAIRCVDWHWRPDDAILATSSDDGGLTFWEADTGKIWHDLPNRFGAVWRPQLASSPEEWWLACLGKDPGITLLNFRTGEEQEIRYDGAIVSLAWSPDGKCLATGGWDTEKVAKVWDAESGKELLSLSGHDGGVYSVAWAPDGSRLATGSNDSTVKVWEAGSGKHLLTLTLEGRWNEVWAVAWSPDGKWLATGSQDGVPRLWSAETGKLLLSLGKHDGAIKSVAWSPDGSRLATASEDRTAKVWEILRETRRTGRTQAGRRNGPVDSKNLEADEAQDQETAFAKPTLHPPFSATRAPRVPDLGSGTEALTLRGHSDGVWSVDWSPDGKRLATGSSDKTAKLWNAETGQELMTLRGESVRKVAWNWNPEANWVAAASTDGWFRFWDTDTGEECLSDIVGGEGWLMAWRPKPRGDSSWIPEKNWLTHALSPEWSWDDSGLGGVAVHEVRTGQGMPILHHREVVRSIAWSPDGMRLATGTIDGTVRVWNLDSGKELLSVRGHSASVTGIAWDPEGGRLATGSEDGKVKVWDTGNGKQLLTLTLSGEPSKVWTVAWSTYRNWLATGSEDKMARVCDAETGKELLTLKGHRGAVRSVAWSPDGKRLATASEDHTAKVWDVAGKPEP